MSWNVRAEGATKDAVKADFAEKSKGSREGGHLPDNALGVIEGAIDALPDCENSTIHVETFGHFATDQTYRSTSNIMVKVENKFAD